MSELPVGNDANSYELQVYSESEHEPAKFDDGSKSQSNSNVETAEGLPIRDFLTPQDRIAKLDRERAEVVASRRTHTTRIGAIVGKVIPYGGLMSSGFNLLSCSIGSGIIALPAAFNASGLGMSLIYVVVIGLLTIYSFTCLAYAGKRTGIRSYEKISKVLLGSGADYFLSFCIWLHCFGGMVTYIKSIQNIVHTFVEYIPSTPYYLTTTSGQQVITVVVWFVAMFPLCLPKEINSLRYFSFFAIGFILYFVICMITHAGIKIHERGGVPDDLVYFQTGNRAVQGLGSFIFAFMCQMNTYEVMEEMHKPTVKRVSHAGVIIAVLASIFYFSAGLFGYLDFGSKVTDSILLYYNPVQDKWIAVAYAGIILKMCVAFALHMIPVRDATYYVVGTCAKEVGWWKNAAVCTVWAGIALIAGLLIPSVTIIFGIVGSFSGGFIGFVYPALFFMYCGNFSPSQVGWFHYIMTYILLIVGVIAVVFGTITSIYAEV